MSFKVMAAACGAALTAASWQIALGQAALPGQDTVPIQASVAQTPEVLPASGYVRLKVTMTVKGETASSPIEFNQCPDDAVFGKVTLKRFVGEEYTGTLGVDLASPGMGKVTLTPVVIKITDPGLFSKLRCNVSVDRIVYSSPLFYVRSIENQNFHVVPTVSRTQALGANISAAMGTVMSIAAQFTGVPAPVAAAAGQRTADVIKNLGLETMEAEGANLAVAPGAALPAKEWEVSGLLRQQKKILFRAELVTARNFFEPTKDAQDKETWTPDQVLQTSFPVDGTTGNAAPGKTVRDYITARFPSSILSFSMNSSTMNGAAGACDAMASDLAKLGHSPRDASVLLWAAVHAFAASAVKNDPALDKITCLAAVSANFPPGLVTAVDQGQVSAPNAQQMKITMTLDNNLTRFFTTGKWNDKSDAGVSMFNYPVEVVDPAHLLLPSSQKIDNNASWALIFDSKDHAMLERVGCFLAVPYDKSVQNLATARQESLYYALGQGASSSPGSQDGKEMVLKFYFKPSRVPADAKVSQVEVSDMLTQAEKSAFVDAFVTHAGRGSQACGVSWKPALVFGQ